MSFSSLSTLLGVGATLLFFTPELADAQIVRRFADGGVQVNAPFVRVNVGPGGGTSVRAPFTAVNAPGGYFFGRRRMLSANGLPRSRAYAQPPTRQPTPVDVDALPYPTPEELAEMDDEQLVETLRLMMGRFNHRLSRLKTGEGWQEYLVLSREVLGAPGAPSTAADVQSIQKVLPRYQSVQDDSQFAKIVNLPSFQAVYAALVETEQRLHDNPPPRPMPPRGPEINDPRSRDINRDMEPAMELESSEDRDNEILPTPTPAELPNATRGERSILKRK